MAMPKFIKGQESLVMQAPIQEGQILVSTDKHNTYIDINGTSRIQLNAKYAEGLTDGSNTITLSDIEDIDARVSILESSGGGGIPATRKINGHTLENDIILSASDVNARPDTWVPSANEVGALPITGGTLTGDLSFKVGSYTCTPLTVKTGDVYGQGVLLGAGGVTIIGGGEGHTALFNALGLNGTEECIHLASDNAIYLHTNCQTIGNRKTVTIDTNGAITAPGGFIGNATSASYLTDRTSGSPSYLNYDAAALTTASYLAAWNGRELRGISTSTVRNVIGAAQHIDITTATDFNTLYVGGKTVIYTIKATGCANAPATNWGTLISSKPSSATFQMYLPDSSNTFYTRTGNGSWTSFAPSNHSHSNYLSTSGGTINGNLAITKIITAKYNSDKYLDIQTTYSTAKIISYSSCMVIGPYSSVQNTNSGLKLRGRYVWTDNSPSSMNCVRDISIRTTVPTSYDGDVILLY